MARLFTKEAVEEAIESANGDPEHIKRSELLSGKVILRGLNTPDNTDVQITYTFNKGYAVGYELDEAPAPAAFRAASFTAPRDGLVRITANYTTWAKLDKGEIEAPDALKSPDYKIEGNMILLLPLMQAVNSWTAKLRQIPKEY